MKKVSPLLFVWLLFVVIGFVSCDDADGGGGVAQVAGQAPAPVPQTGQTRRWHSDGNNVYVVDCAGTGQDGDVQAGVEWPDPRFTDNGDGTITDNLTGLVWLKDASCFGQRTWAQALTDANNLADGKCGLTDGSVAGDWRLPNRKELTSLLDLEYSYPALPTHQYFMNFQSTGYWSSSTSAGSSINAWFVNFNNGAVSVYDKSNFNFDLPVRGGS